MIQVIVYLLNKLLNNFLKIQILLDVFFWLVNGDKSNSNNFFINYSSLKIWGYYVTCYIP